jgi:hypothetical protein
VKPDAEIDPKIRLLVDALNAFYGVATIGSCGGHAEPLKGGQWPDGSWYVTFEVRRNTHGWRALEFLAWLVNHDYIHAEPHVRLYPDSLPPYLNKPGSMLKFALEGWQDANPDALATFMNRLREESYIPPAKRAKKRTRESRGSARSTTSRRKRRR